MTGYGPGTGDLPAYLGDPLFADSFRELNRALSGFVKSLRNARDLSLIEVVDVIEDLSWRVELAHGVLLAAATTEAQS